jgi:hypothetical protein
MSQNQINVIRATYNKVGPTSSRDSGLAITKKIQVRVAPKTKGKSTVLWGLKTPYRQPNRGDGSQATKFAGIFPRMRF